MNVLSDPVFSTNLGKPSLPGLLAALASGRVRDFPRLRAHQRAAFHMFLCQIAALAVLRGSRMDDESGWRDEERWCEALLAITDGDRKPWDIFPASPADPGFMQPPEADGLKWNHDVETPDEMDMIVTSKNHDVKSAIAGNAGVEDWLFALITTQTSDGYGGAGHYGIARMNGGKSSRVMLALVPVAENGPGARMGSIDVSAWWRRDTRLLVKTARNGYADYHRDLATRPGGHALLWTLPWGEGDQVNVQDIDPLAIEACRRLRLCQGKDGIVSARRSTSSKERVHSAKFSIIMDDPWAPIQIDPDAKDATKNTKTITLGEAGRFDYRRMLKILRRQNHDMPIMALPQPDDDVGAMGILAEAMARGEKITGLQSRLVPMPENVLRKRSLSDFISTASDLMLEDIKNAWSCLEHAILCYAHGGERIKNPSKTQREKDRKRVSPASGRFDAAIDAVFFKHLWDMADAEDDDASTKSRQGFRAFLRKAIQGEFDVARDSIPVQSARRHRALALARRSLHYGLVKHEFTENQT